MNSGKLVRAFLLVSLTELMLVAGGCKSGSPSASSGGSQAIMEEAYNYSGTYPAIGDIRYRDGKGHTVTVTAFRGRLNVVVSPSTSATAVVQLFRSLGDSVIAQVPRLGMYWVLVPPGTEDTSIARLRSNTMIVRVAPSTPGQLSQVSGGVTDLNTAPEVSSTSSLRARGDVLQFDDFSTSAGGTCPGVSHGQFVGSVLSNTAPGDSTVSVSQYQANMVGLTPLIVTPNSLAFQLARAAQGAAEEGKVKVVNISEQGIWVRGAGNEGNVDRHNCTSAVCEQLKANEAAFLEQLYVAVENMDEATRKHLVIVVSAGNSGLDLSAEMSFLRALTPNAAKHILLVGGTRADGRPSAGLNSAENPDDILFAQGENVIASVGGTPCSSSGTSFAAPQVARLAAQVIKQSPGMTGDQVVQAIRNAAPAGQASVPFLPNGYRTMPTLAQVVGSTTPAADSIAPTSQSFGPAGGTGTIAVIVAKTRAWTAVSNAAWITVTSGSSGTGSGTVAYTVSANPTTTQRTGTITVAGKIFAVTQSGTTGGGGTNGLYDGTWRGTFNYTARVPQPDGSSTTVQGSFTLTVTLVTQVAVPGVSQFLNVTQASCSDQAFGATSSVVPGAASVALLPATVGSISQTGEGINVNFPNGSVIGTTNSAGALSVSADGRTLANTNAVADDAFLASTGIGDSNTPGSGPGGYAYNWCTFTSWTLVKQ